TPPFSRSVSRHWSTPSSTKDRAPICIATNLLPGGGNGAASLCLCGAAGALLSGFLAVCARRPSPANAATGVAVRPFRNRRRELSLKPGADSLTKPPEMKIHHKATNPKLYTFDHSFDNTKSILIRSKFTHLK